MQQIENNRGKVFKVVNQDQLEAHTRTGWNLMWLVQGTKLVHVSKQAKVLSPPGYGPNGLYQPGGVQTDAWVEEQPMPETLFLLEYDPDRHQQEQQTKIDTLITEKQLLEAKAKEHYARVKDLKNHAEAHEKTATALGNRIKSISEQAEKADAAKRLLEGDIAKIRIAIGEKQMKEILGY